MLPYCVKSTALRAKMFDMLHDADAWYASQRILLMPSHGLRIH